MSLIKKTQDQKYMSQIILKGRTAHLASYAFFTSDVNQYKNMSLSTTKNTFFKEHLSLATFVLWIVQSFYEQIFIEHLQKQSFADVLQNRCS